MPAKKSYSKHIPPDAEPIVEIAGKDAACYIRLTPAHDHNANYSHTITKHRWPMLNIDISKDGHIMGIETIGFKDITLGTILKKAGLKAPNETINRTKYILI
jgi:uncharacterized protein YuzE